MFLTTYAILLIALSVYECYIKRLQKNTIFTSSKFVLLNKKSYLMMVEKRRMTSLTDEIVTSVTLYNIFFP